VSAYCFGEFVLDCGTRELRRAGETVHLSPKAFQLLQILVEAAPRALSKAELQDRLWPDTFVIEANLQHLIVEIRSALRDDPHHPHHIRTVHGFGYAFKEEPAKVGAPGPHAAVCRLRWDGGRATLAEGQHVIGRDPAAEVFLDSSTVSRSHARICVTGTRVTLEDLGSKNGSFVSGRPVEGTVELSDGDVIRIGAVALTVRIHAWPQSTDTWAPAGGAEPRTSAADTPPVRGTKPSS